MAESKRLQAIRSLLQKSAPLEELLAFLQDLKKLHSDFTSPTYQESQQKKDLQERVEALRIPELPQLIAEITPPSSIIALPLSRSQSFTVFFVLVPRGLKFDWHSHPKMSGISKCVCGQLEVATISKNVLKMVKPGRFTYPKSEIKYEVLRGEGPSIATIEAEEFNIHRIRALEMSAFIDILMPDYPQNYCDFYLSRKQEEEVVEFKKVEESRDKLEIWDSYLEKVIRGEKTVVKNVILQMNHSE